MKRPLSFTRGFDGLLKTISISLLLIASVVSTAQADYTWENVPTGYGLAWSDEFNGAVGSAPNSAYWSYDTGTGQPNNELENYTNSTNNCKVIADPNAVDGKSLVIIALDPGGNNDQMGDYTSARIDTEDKKTFTYGYMEARVRMPYGQGIWPAFWMLGNDIDTVSWPACDEIDIMENIGNTGDQGTNHMSLHDGNDTTFYPALPGGQLYHNAYHTFAALWQPNQIQFFIDGSLMVTDTPATMGNNWAFNNNPNFFLLNVATGGNWPGNPDGSTSFPQTMYVDYVRAYQTGFATPTPVVQSTWRVRCGGDNYTDSQGNLWEADTNFTGGWPSNPTANTIAGALPASGDQTLYQWERYGNTTGGQTLTYTFNVPTGSNYQVTLKFAEDYWTAAGQREFNYAINGATEATNFDIFAAAGGEFKAIDKVYTITPNASGQIVIQLTPGGADNPKIDAIQIIPVAGSPTATFTKTATATLTSTPTLTPTPITLSTWRVNAGGPAYTDSQGHVWSADENFTGGTAAVTTSTITGALPASSDQTLYQSQRYGSPFSYTFNVPAGSYQLTLKFAETYWTAAGQRTFNVSVNGTQVLTNFDIFATAGGQDKAIDEVFNNIAPSGGVITITFGPASADNAEVQAIQIIPQPATATPTLTFSKTPTSTFTLTASSTATLTYTATTSSTFTNTVTSTNSFTATPVNTGTPTATKTSSNSPTGTPTSSATASYTTTATPVNTATSSSTATSSPTGTSTSSPTASSTATNTPLTPVNTATLTNTGTASPTGTSTSSATATFTVTLTPTATNTLTFTTTVTNTPTSSRTPTASATNSFTSTPTATPTLTYSFTFTKTASPTVTWTNTSTWTATAKIPTATSTFTVTPTYTHTAVPPTSTPTAASACSGVPVWNGNFVAYSIGQKVSYDGELYQCIQAHTSEPTWEPNVVPALWKDLGPCGGAAPAPALAVVQPMVYPNPATSSTTTIQLPVTNATNVTVQIFTVSMRQVQTINVPQVIGNTLTIQLLDKSGINLANGLYYFQIQASGQKWTNKVLILR